MIPNRVVFHRPTSAYVQALMTRIGRSQVWVAERSGISRRRLQYLLVGQKTVDGKTSAVRLNYPEQVTLELLAEAGEAFPKKRANPSTDTGEALEKNRVVVYPAQSAKAPL